MTLPIELLANRSIYYYLKGILPSGVNVTDAYPISTSDQDPPLTFPTVSVDSRLITSRPFELGNNETLQERAWAVEVFASTSVQRDALSALIYHALESGILVYDYNAGFPPAVNPPELGILDVSDISIKPVYVFRDLVKDLYWRNSITFSTDYRPF